MTFSTTRKEKFLKYFFDQKDRTFHPENNSLSTWKFSRHFLVSSSQQAFESSWIVEGQGLFLLVFVLSHSSSSPLVPEPVVMLLQLLKYSRFGYEQTMQNPENSVRTVNVKVY